MKVMDDNVQQHSYQAPDRPIRQNVEKEDT